jgi:DNA-binding NarL/FixJ family response regulator
MDYFTTSEVTSHNLRLLVPSENTRMLSVVESSYSPLLAAAQPQRAADEGTNGVVVNESAPAISTAVVAARSPIFRAGVVASLRLAGVTKVTGVDALTDAIDLACDDHATLLVLGDGDAATIEPLTHQTDRLGAVGVLVLVAGADRATLVPLLEAGVDAVALPTITPEDLATLVERVLAGERAVDPALMSVLVDVARDRAAGGGPDPARPLLPTGPIADGPGPPLTSKELQVLGRLAAGASNADIAAALFVSPATVKTHLAHIYVKLGVGSRHGATSRAMVLGLLS